MAIELDRVVLKRLQEQCVEALATIAAEYGLQVEYGGGRFSKNDFNAKFKFYIQGDDGLSKAEETKFKANCFMYGLKETMFGKYFTCDGTEFRITGINTRAKKHPIMCYRVSDGARFKFPAELVLRCRPQRKLNRRRK